MSNQTSLSITTENPEDYRRLLGYIQAQGFRTVPHPILLEIVVFDPTEELISTIPESVNFQCEGSM